MLSAFILYTLMFYKLYILLAAKSLQSCPTLCDPIDGSPPGSPVLGILQARILKWFAISFSNTWKWKVKVKSLSRVQLIAMPRTAAHQAPPSMGFSRQEYWSGGPLPSPYSRLERGKNTTYHISLPALLDLCCSLERWSLLPGGLFCLTGAVSRAEDNWVWAIDF